MNSRYSKKLIALAFLSAALLGMTSTSHATQSQIATPKSIDNVEQNLSVEQLKKYEGQYQLAPGFVITISEKDAKLMAQATGQPSFEIFALGEHRFFAKVADIKLQFKLNAEGKSEEMTLFQNGQQMPAPRVK